MSLPLGRCRAAVLGLIASAWLATPIAQAQADRAEQLLSQGREARASGRPFEALAAFAQARALKPEDAAIARALADVLVDLGALHAAADALRPGTDAGLQARLAGLRLRWAIEIAPASPDPARRFDAIDAALDEVERLLAQARRQSPVDAVLVLRLSRDRAVALRHRERWQHTLDQVEALRVQGDDPPPVFVRQAQADATLALRRPAEARALYADALARLSPDERAADPRKLRDLLKGRFYAEVECEDFDAAFATVDELAALDREPFRRAGPRARLAENGDWLDAQVLGAQVRSYADMPAEAWTRIEPLVRDAPSLAWLRAVAAGIAAQRGWPRRADEEISIAHSLAPDDFGLKLAQVDSDLRRHRLVQASERLAPLTAAGGDLPGVQRIARELDAQSGPSLRIDAGGGSQRGDALRVPSADWDIGLRVDSALIGERFRLVGFTDRREADFDPQHGTRSRVGAGLGARWPDVGVEALAWSQHGSLRTGGASLEGFWEPDDHWRLAAVFERHTPDAPLRADVAGVTGNGWRLGAAHAWHESAQAEIEVQAIDYSDGNDHVGASVLSRLRVLDRSRLDITLTPRLDWVENSREDVAYFSPARAWSATIAAELAHVAWRRYEDVLVQRATFMLGVFDQQLPGSRTIGSVRYEHAWRRDPFSELSYGVEWSSRVYDGQREDGWRGYLSLVHRFAR